MSQTRGKGNNMFFLMSGRNLVIFHCGIVIIDCQLWQKGSVAIQSNFSSILVQIFSGNESLFYDVVLEIHNVFSALLLQEEEEEERGFSQLSPLRFKSSQLENQEQFSASFLSPYSDTEPTFSCALNKRMRATVQRPPLHWNRTWWQAGCVATWETGVEVILTRCWNNKLSMRFCCSKSNTRVRSFTHSSFKSWKRGETGWESDHEWG